MTSTLDGTESTDGLDGLLLQILVVLFVGVITETKIDCPLMLRDAAKLTTQMATQCSTSNHPDACCNISRFFVCQGLPVWDTVN